MVLRGLLVLGTFVLSLKAVSAQDYRAMEARILALSNVEIVIVGKVEKEEAVYPVYALTTAASKKNEKKQLNVLLSGGVHGDEPAGVFALLQFLEKEAPRYAKEFRFFVFPCVNPGGFATGTAENSAGKNINRSFKKDSPALEAKWVMEQLQKWDRKFVFSIDMHEIPPYWEGEGFKAKDNPHTAYLYESQRDKKMRIGPAMLAGLPKDIEVCQWPRIYGDVAVGGLVTYPEGNFNQVYAEQTTLDGYLFEKLSSHTFTAETPIDWPMEKRVRTHLSWLKTALEKKRGSAP